MPKIIKHCVICGAEFKVWPSQAERRITCSRECNIKWQKEAQRGENNGNWKGGPRSYTCDYCGKVFFDTSYSHTDSPRRFCTRECANNWQKGKNVRTLEQAIPVAKVCPNCSRHFTLPPSKSDRRFCSRTCATSYMLGPNHPTWKGGPVTKRCENCGAEYQVIRSRASESRFCSVACANAAKRFTTRCEWCDKEFQKPLSRQFYDNHFCCDEHRLYWLNSVVSAPSKAELAFHDLLQQANIKFVFQRPFKRYMLDFAIEDQKIDVEVDSEFHHSLKERVLHDAKRDKTLEDNGWTVVRIPSEMVHREPDKALRQVFKALAK